MKQCRACGGVFTTVDGDGFTMYHVCPTLSAAELVQLIPALDLATAATFPAVFRDGHRDENIAIDAHGKVGIVSAGFGVDDIVEKATPATAHTIADVIAIIKSRSGIITP